MKASLPTPSPPPSRRYVGRAWTREARRGICPHCNRERRLTPDGKIHSHFLASFGQCPGVGRAPRV